MALRSADDLLVAVDNTRLEGMGVKIADTPEPIVRPEPAENAEITHLSEENREISAKTSPEDAKTAPLEATLPSSVEAKPEVKADVNLDEYGNELPKPKMYSEDEVQRMIRERLSRGSLAQTQPPVQHEAPAAVLEGENGWELELESVVERTLGKLTQKQQQEQMRKQEQRLQSEFEVKFNMGMDKFSDFREVVQGKPITDSMMMAARSMNDPASFIYAASKNHATELDRIAKIPDPYYQAVEIGKLEERMKKSAKVSAAPRPATTTHGDMTANTPPKRSIDNLIREHARTKFGR